MMHCTNERNGEFHIHHSSYDKPIVKVSGDTNPLTNTVTETWDGSSTRLVRLESANAVRNTLQTIWLNEDFRKALLPIGNGDKTKFTADLEKEVCRIEMGTTLKPNKQVVTMKMK